MSSYIICSRSSAKRLRSSEEHSNNHPQHPLDDNKSLVRVLRFLRNFHLKSFRGRLQGRRPQASEDRLHYHLSLGKSMQNRGAVSRGTVHLSHLYHMK
jgi:hypothetical protein